MCLTVYIFKKNQFHGMSPKVIESKRVPESIWIGTFANKIFLQKKSIYYIQYTHCIYAWVNLVRDQNIYFVLNSFVLFNHTYFDEKLKILTFKFADLNGDGYDDLLIGAPLHSDDWTELIPRFLNIGEKRYVVPKRLALYVILCLN